MRTRPPNRRLHPTAAEEQHLVSNDGQRQPRVKHRTLDRTTPSEGGLHDPG
jgi:hypothetical protein